jgi:thiamine kinase-like enzyme
MIPSETPRPPTDCIVDVWKDVLPYLQRIPLLTSIVTYDSHLSGDAKTASRSTIRRLLGGLTNLNYLIERSPGDRYVLRVPGVGTAEYINRRNEKICAQVTSTILVNAPVLFFDEADGLMLTRYIEGSVTMSADLFSNDLSSVSRAGQVLRRLHRNAGPFPSDFKLFATIDDYERLLMSKAGQMSLPDGYHELRDSVEGFRGVLQQLSIAHVPSHCDPLCENFLDVGKHGNLSSSTHG